ncbi:MAG: universal stress protein [Chloroflexota bacterium]|nr:MAG: universal stress protein [Chloroflexota bacterium]
MRTLICIRQLPYAGNTVSFGGLIAGLEQSPITLMTVVSDETQSADADSELEQACRLINGHGVETKIRIGAPKAEILKEAQEGSYATIVVGAHDAASMLEALLGSVTDKVAGKADATVLVVRGERTSELKKVLVAIGGQKMNHKVVEVGARLSSLAQATVTVLFVTNPVPTMYTGLDEIEETLTELLKTDTPIARYLRWSAQYLADQGVAADIEVAQGVASDEIMRVARQGDYDMVVIGAAGAPGPIRRLFVDQVTPHVVERAPCPVLVVR